MKGEKENCLKENQIIDEQRLKELEKSKFYLDALLNTIPDSIYFKDTQSRFTKISKSLAVLFNSKSIQDVIGKTDFDFQNSAHAKEAFEDEQEIISNDKPLVNVVEKEIWGEDCVRWISTTKLPLKNDKNEIIGIFGISRDITDIKNLEFSVVSKNEELLATEEELRQTIEELQTVQDEILKQKKEIERQKDKILAQNRELELHRNNLAELVEKRTEELMIAKKRAEESDRLKSAFLANMSHEIRTPMNSIVGFSKLLKFDDLTATERDSYIDLINNNADSLMMLINDILDLSMIESNQLNVVNERFEINELMHHTYSTVNIVNNEKPNLQFKLNNGIEERNIKINTDKFRVRQILINLLNNAFKFTQAGLVELGIKLDNNNLVFYVKDSGKGIPQNKVGTIFDRFTKLEKISTDAFRGAGLGLTISYRLAKILGGDLFVDSIEGVGSTFIFTLPKNNIVG